LVAVRPIAIFSQDLIGASQEIQPAVFTEHVPMDDFFAMGARIPKIRIIACQNPSFPQKLGNLMDRDARE